MAPLAQLSRVRLRRTTPPPGAACLPHPSWQLAVGGQRETGAAPPTDASEFWARLGL